MGINNDRVALKGPKQNKFTARGILAMNQPGWYADPETRGLYLRVFEGADGPSRSWLYRFTSPVSGKRRAMGLGSVEICSLANARQKSLGLRRAIFDGIDPIDQRQEKKYLHLRQRLLLQKLVQKRLEWLSVLEERQ